MQQKSGVPFNFLEANLRITFPRSHEIFCPNAQKEKLARTATQDLATQRWVLKGSVKFLPLNAMFQSHSKCLLMPEWLLQLELDLLVPDLAEQKDSVCLMEKIPGNYKELPGAELPPSLRSLLSTPCSAAPFRAAEKIFLIFMFFRKMPEIQQGEPARRHSQGKFWEVLGIQATGVGFRISRTEALHEIQCIKGKKHKNMKKPYSTVENISFHATQAARLRLNSDFKVIPSGNPTFYLTIWEISIMITLNLK